ncbi:MAG TPA: hypothetical protein VHU18_05960 [Rhizomicrobium sp.]|jgi:hypothetical protein|nr:hypothetical protein [Rhizomicrobium sp.]
MRSYDLAALLNRRRGNKAKPSDDLETLTGLKAEIEAAVTTARTANGNAALAHAQGTGTELAVRDTARALQETEQRLRGIDAAIEQHRAIEAERQREATLEREAAQDRAALELCASYVGTAERLQADVAALVSGYEAHLAARDALQGAVRGNPRLPEHLRDAAMIGIPGKFVGREMFRMSPDPSRHLVPGAERCVIAQTDITPLATHAHDVAEAIRAALEPRAQR